MYERSVFHRCQVKDLHILSTRKNCELPPPCFFLYEKHLCALFSYSIIFMIKYPVPRSEWFAGSECARFDEDSR